MPFTIVLAILTLLSLGVVFGVAYKIKGVKFAFITTGIALGVFGILHVVTILLITSMM